MNVFNLLRNNAPCILTGMAIFGVAWTSVEAVKATPKAMHILEEQELDVRKEPVKAAKACWKCYIYPAAILVGTSACILGINYLLEKDKDELIAALVYSEMKRKEHIDFENGMFGPLYSEQTEECIKESRRSRNDIPNEPLMEGMMWCYEPESDQWFQTNTEQVLWAELTANKMFANHGELRFNQYLQLFPNAKTVDGLDYFGWFKYDDDGYWDFNWSFYPGGTPWIDIQPQINTKENYMVLAYGMHPGDDPDCHDLEEPEQFEVKSF